MVLISTTGKGHAMKANDDYDKLSPSEQRNADFLVYDNDRQEGYKKNIERTKAMMVKDHDPINSAQAALIDRSIKSIKIYTVDND